MPRGPMKGASRSTVWTRSVVNERRGLVHIKSLVITMIVLFSGEEGSVGSFVMEKRRLSRTGLMVSVLGFGGGYLRDLDGDAACDVVNRAIDRGINFFDVAPIYGDGEVKLGKVLARRRDECIVATKTEEDSGAGTRKLLEQSLKRLRTDRIDVYQLSENYYGG